MLVLRWLSAAALIVVLSVLLWRYGHPGASASRGRRAAARYAEHPSAAIALFALLAMYVLSALAPWLATHDPIALLPQAFVNHAPTRELLFGTDYVGRDVFSRLLYGTRLSLSIALLSTIVSPLLGTTSGPIAGFVGGAPATARVRPPLGGAWPPPAPAHPGLPLPVPVNAGRSRCRSPLYGAPFPGPLNQVADLLDAAALVAVYPTFTQADIMPISVG